MWSCGRMMPALAGLLLGLAPAYAEEPARLRLEPVPATVSANQGLAEAVGQQLRDSPLRNFRIEITCFDGTIALEGTVRDQAQRQEAARLVQSVPGVRSVMNRLQISAPAGSDNDRPVQRAQFDPQPEPVPPPRRVEPGHPLEPVPSFRAPPPLLPGAGEPPLPPYAWPTYAPYNNYSRVAYPSCYPYEAFPYFGPFYPFPKVPLGWRHVKLEWDDCHWWLSTHAQKRDWWTVRYW